MITDSTRLALAPDVTFQSLGDAQDTVILSLKSGYLYTCNRTSARFLSAVDGRRTFAELVDLLRGQYDVAEAKLRGDLLSLGDKLLAERLLTVVE